MGYETILLTTTDFIDFSQRPPAQLALMFRLGFLQRFKVDEAEERRKDEGEAAGLQKRRADRNTEAFMYRRSLSRVRIHLREICLDKYQAF